jgi:hypothetical protein
MDITYYAFATYIFLLICGVVWFFAKVLRGGKAKGDRSSYEKEQRLFTLYQNVEDMLASFEELADETRKGTEEALKKAEEMVEEARRLSREIKAAAEPAEPKPAAARGTSWSEQPEEPQVELAQTSSPEELKPRLVQKPVMETEERIQSGPPLKINEKILLLSAQGLGATEIAKTLGVSVREVTLALELGRK